MTKRTNIVFTVSEGNDTNSLTVNLTETATGTDFTSISQTIPTTSFSELTLGAATVPDLLMVKNNDDTNYIEMAVDSGGTNRFSRITAGRAAYIPCLAGVSYYASACTGNVEIKILTAVA